MNWILVGLLGSLGLVTALLSTHGYTRGIEPFLWLILGVFAALVVARVAGQRYFLHGLAIGLCWGALNGLTQAALFATYMANNPESARQFGDSGPPIPPRLMFLVMGPLIGLVTGVVLGGLCWAGHRVVPAITTSNVATTQTAAATTAGDPAS